ncbi:helix-turn-helix domain-containing protein [Microbacterium esteraromaticum]|uniref:helix-turn-helix domain-containing protein n=1 Tax=Microbacterium esteraromaticum TaxID=57043 RepID=UPI001CD1CFCB|nr:helix-turn-helix transcriptional regulator [Microbacterium esteraromaticum]MCA1306356.1 helix-turn-helix domain-containing protein [Microbacterium esteraromaticum]
MTNIDETVGGNVKTLRQRIGLTQSELAERVSDDLAFTRNTVYAIETSTRRCTVADLFGLAAALDCTVADLVKSSEPITLGGDDRIDVDAYLQAPGESPDARAWEQFENAGDALADVRNAWDRYLTAMSAVRRRAVASPALRERIERALAKRQREHAEYVVELFEFREPDNFEGYDAFAAANPTPGIVAARDALDGRALHPHLWRARPRAPENVRPSGAAHRGRERS